MKMLLLLCLLLSLTLPGGAFCTTSAEDDNKVHKVEVVNLPTSTTVTGSVSVNGRLSHSSMERFEKMVIPVIARNDPVNMRRIGTVATDGFTSLIVSFQGQTLNKYTLSPGTIGVVLVPDETPILDAFRDNNLLLFSFEARSEFDKKAFPYFASKSEKFTVSFPQYKIYMYNSTNASVEANLYIYLTN